MGVCVRSIMYNIVENYMTNVDEVMALVKKYDHLFSRRDNGNAFSTQYLSLIHI